MVVLLLVQCVVVKTVSAQYRGRVVNGERQPVEYILVYSESDNTYSDVDGKFNLIASEGDSIRIESSLYEAVSIPVASWKQDTTILLNSVALVEALVVARKTAEPGSYTLESSQLAAVPAIAGEVDVLRSLQTLPSVAGGSEGSVAPVIRGSDANTSYILLDGAPVFSPSTFFGYQGAINYEAVRSVSAYTGLVPARFGGRSGGVIDIKTRNGNAKNQRQKISVGFPNVGATVEGPLTKRLSYFGAGRGSYLLFPTLFAGNSFLQGDGLAKLSYTAARWTIHGKVYRNVSNISSESTVGSNNAETSIKFRTGYGNTLGAINASYAHRDISLTLNTYTTAYNSFVQQETVDRSSGTTQDDKATSLTRSSSIGAAFGWTGDAFRIDVGSSLERTQLTTTVRGRGEDPFRFSDGAKLLTIGSYVQAAYEPQSGIVASVGVRYPVFRYSTGRTNAEFEPRASVGYQLRNLRVTANAGRNYQYIHAFGASTNSGTFETYALPSETYDVSYADQLSADLNLRLPALNLELRLSTYYKRLNSLVERLNTDIPTFTTSLANESADFTTGEGQTSGVEVLVNWKADDFAVRASYGYARSFRKFAGINNGDWYPFQWDRPHRLNVLATYEREASKWSYTAGVTLESGYNFSAPVGSSFSELGKFRLSEFRNPILIYSNVNGFRSKSMQRLDLGATYTNTRPSGRTLEWRFSLYNALFRANPSASFVETTSFVDRTSQLTQEVKITTRSLFRLIPGVQFTYTW